MEGTQEKNKKKIEKERSLPPGIEPGSRAMSGWMTSSHTDHYTTEDLLVLAPAVASCCAGVFPTRPL